MHRLSIPADFEQWRSAAKTALAAGYKPHEVDFHDAAIPRTLDLGLLPPAPATGHPIAHPHAPRAFFDTAQIAAVHRDTQRWNLLYRILYRLQTEPGLMRDEVDHDIDDLLRLRKQVHHDLHKMHAFVRFRKVASPDGDHYIAWYRPDHRILPLAAPFFQDRFAVMNWTILTPDQSVSWNAATKQLTWFEGAGKESAPQEDELEDLWRGYYSSIFNPARLNPEAMRSEMPIRYWQHLPEVAVLPELLQRAGGRVSEMVATQKAKTSAAPFVPEKHTIPVLREAMPSCRGCELYKHATQVVPGRGTSKAHLMLVGEQPGDKEDLEGEAFVGPAGKVLARAMEELHISQKDIYLTNAVKHFKFVQRGKIRLHQNPRMSEVTACRPWLQAELDAVKPRVVLCLGATAAKSLLGGTFTLMNSRGKQQTSPYAERVFATVHPSAILRAPDEQARELLYTYLKDDLATAYHASLRA